MAEKLPRFLDPNRAADQSSNFAGQMPATALTRLGDQYQVDDAIMVELAFDRNGRGRVVVSGRIGIVLQTICQRCLQPMTVEINQDIRSELVEATGQDPAVLEDDADSVEFTDRLDVYELVEDEVVLACPIVPLHPKGACEAPADNAAQQGPDEQPQEQHTKPFAGLASLMKGDKDPR